MHRGSISGGSMNTRVGQLYIASNEDFRDLYKLGDAIHHLNIGCISKRASLWCMPW